MEDNNKIIKQPNLDEIIEGLAATNTLNDLSEYIFDQYQAQGWYPQCIPENIIKFNSWDSIINYIKKTYYQIKSHNFYIEYECGNIHINLDFGYELDNTYLTPGNEEDNINNYGIKELIMYCFNIRLLSKISLAEYIHGIAYFNYCLLEKLDAEIYCR